MHTDITPRKHDYHFTIQIVHSDNGSMRSGHPSLGGAIHIIMKEIHKLDACIT